MAMLMSTANDSRPRNFPTALTPTQITTSRADAAPAVSDSTINIRSTENVATLPIGSSSAIDVSPKSQQLPLLGRWVETDYGKEGVFGGRITRYDPTHRCDEGQLKPHLVHYEDGEDVWEDVHGDEAITILPIDRDCLQLKGKTEKVESEAALTGLHSAAEVA